MGLVSRQITRSPLVCLTSPAPEPSFFPSGCQRTIFETSSKQVATACIPEGYWQVNSLGDRQSESELRSIGRVHVRQPLVFPRHGESDGLAEGETAGFRKPVLEFAGYAGATQVGSDAFNIRIFKAGIYCYAIALGEADVSDKLAPEDIRFLVGTLCGLEFNG